MVGTIKQLPRHHYQAEVKIAAPHRDVDRVNVRISLRIRTSASGTQSITVSESDEKKRCRGWIAGLLTNGAQQITHARHCARNSSQGIDHQSSHPSRQPCTSVANRGWTPRHLRGCGQAAGLTAWRNSCNLSEARCHGDHCTLVRPCQAWLSFCAHHCKTST
jgi:hypothetical protein